MSVAALAGDRYVDAQTGSNANDGLGAGTAWRTLTYALGQLAAAVVAHRLLPRRVELDVEGPPAPATRAPPGQALHRDLVGDHELQRGGEGPVALGQRVLQRLGLSERAGEPVEDHPVLRVGLLEPVEHHANHDVVGDELAVLHVGPGLAPERGVAAHVLACEFRMTFVPGNR